MVASVRLRPYMRVLLQRNHMRRAAHARASPQHFRLRLFAAPTSAMAEMIAIEGSMPSGASKHASSDVFRRLQEAPETSMAFVYRRA